MANVTGLVAGQEYSRIGDFFRFADTPHGDIGLPEVEALVRIRGDGQAGDGVHKGDVDGPALCRMFNQATLGKGAPRYLSSDHDPLFRYHQWKANLRIREIDGIKTVPHVPVSHPFTERLVGTIRREFLDQTLFWNERDLEKKLREFQDYYNAHRVHQVCSAKTPSTFTLQGG